jgi:hypothetical protein
MPKGGLVLQEADEATRRRLSAYSLVLQRAFMKDEQGIQRVPGALLSQKLSASMAEPAWVAAGHSPGSYQEVLGAIVHLNTFFAPNG